MFTANTPQVLPFYRGTSSLSKIDQSITCTRMYSEFARKKACHALRLGFRMQLQAASCTGNRKNCVFIAEAGNIEGRTDGNATADNYEMYLLSLNDNIEAQETRFASFEETIDKLMDFMGRQGRAVSPEPHERPPASGGGIQGRVISPRSHERPPATPVPGIFQEDTLGVSRYFLNVCPFDYTAFCG